MMQYLIFLRMMTTENDGVQWIILRAIVAAKTIVATE